LIVRTVDALAGAGKTCAAGKHAARTARLGHKTLFVQPTKDLITETITGIRQHSPDIRLTAIHSGITEHVVADIVQHTKDASEHQGEEGFKVRVTAYIERTQFCRGAPWTRSARTARAST
jgi:reverse gyrase